MDPAQRQSQSATLAAALRLIRTHRRIRKADLAQAMGMSPRNYDLFEAGKGRINLERIYRFAEITKSDYHAILAALAFGSPAFALNTADNQMMTILMAALQDFEAEFGDLVGELDSRTIINVFTRALKELALHLSMLERSLPLAQTPAVGVAEESRTWGRVAALKGVMRRRHSTPWRRYSA